MFGRSTKASSKASLSTPTNKRGLIPSVIASGMHVLGNVVSDGVLDIDGNIDGNVRGRQVSVRPNGCIRGDVTAESVDVYGTIEGVIKAQVVNLYASAHVVGTIMHEALTIEDGAFVDGKFKRTDRVFVDDDSNEIKRLSAPNLDTGFSDNDDPTSEVEIKILENLRLIR